MWTKEDGLARIYKFDALTDDKQRELLEYMNQHFSLEDFDRHLKHRRDALENLDSSRTVLDGAKQHYPEVISADDISGSAKDLAGFGVVFTAGGDGERLRLSLEEQGVSADALADFTKATYALPEFYKDFGALHINLSVIAQICAENGVDIPVVITTGPEGSVTARVIPEVLEKYNNFGLKKVIVVKQDERLHFTQDEQIAYKIDGDVALPITHPDESGGPLVKLKESVDGQSALDVMTDAGCEKVIILQGTAIYDPTVVYKIAAAAKSYDGVGIGIARDAFPENDPYGTYVAVEKEGERRVCILEQDVRNDETRVLTDAKSGKFLPYNTGFYAFDIKVLAENVLPDYATPPKQVCPELPKSAKIGYAATDILPMASNPAVLTISPDSYGVIKSADDLAVLASLGKQLKLDKLVDQQLTLTNN